MENKEQPANTNIADAEAEKESLNKSAEESSNNYSEETPNDYSKET
jgi:hypothetical protein